MIQVRLLGPPRVERDGELLAFDTRKAVALLAHLALTDRARPRDSLADLLWPDTDPERARGALRRTLSTLRSAVGEEHLEATRDAVRLCKGPDLHVDVDRFRDLRAAGDLPGAAAAHGGDLLEGFAVRGAPDFEDWVRAENDLLQRELVATLADLAGELERRGDHTAALPVVRRWLAADPLDEPAHRALMRLCAATGDRAAALTQYRECVRTLNRELGVPPLTETTQLYEAISSGAYPAPTREPAPAPARDGTPAAEAVPAAAGAAATPFVGRDDELARLLATYDAVGPDGRVALVEGEAGIGKTRLAEELAESLRAQGARVLTARAYQDEGDLAYGPVTALLTALAADASPLEGLDAAARAQAARLAPALGPPATEPPDAPGAQSRFVDGLWQTLAAAADERPGVLVVDDAQWADAATLSLLAYGLRRLEGRRLLLVLTWRTPAEHPLRRAAATLARSGAGAVVSLGRLDEAAVAGLVADPQQAHRLWQTTEGVPLLLVEYLRSGTSERMPAGVRELLLARLDRVGETARQVLSAAAVLGRAFAIDTARTVSGRTEEETVGALEELAAHGVVREHRAGYDFDHELLRRLAYEETGLARRRLLHRRAAEVSGTPAAARARHLQAAGADAAAAVAHREAASAARALHAHTEALEHLRAALALDHPDQATLLTEVGEELTALGDYPEALASLEAAAAAASEVDLPRVEHRLGRLRLRLGEWPLAEAHLGAALAAIPDTDAATRAELLADLGLAAQAKGDLDRARDLGSEAAALAEAAGDVAGLCRAYNLLGIVATAAGDPEGAADVLQSGLELADSVGDEDLRVATLNNLALTWKARQQWDEAVALTQEALTAGTRLGDRHREAALHNNLADLLHASGRTAEAMDHLKTAVAIFADVGSTEEQRPEVWKLVRW